MLEAFGFPGRNPYSGLVQTSRQVSRSVDPRVLSAALKASHVRFNLLVEILTNEEVHKGTQA